MRLDRQTIASTLRRGATGCLMALAIVMPTARPATALGDGDVEVVRPPILHPVQGPVERYYVQFSARGGEGSITGHVNIRTVAVLGGGRRVITSLFGFYADGGAEEYLQSVAGTPGVVGFNRLDLTERPVAAFRVTISEDQHARILAAVTRLRRTERWFELFSRNCNYLAGRIARLIGLKAPGDTAQLPEDYVAEMQALNGR
ncbi:MAG: hypothetical protein R3D33_05660 [Hyphomicrobiaceae bacterium]